MCQVFVVVDVRDFVSLGLVIEEEVIDMYFIVMLLLLLVFYWKVVMLIVFDVVCWVCGDGFVGWLIFDVGVNVYVICLLEYSEVLVVWFEVFDGVVEVICDCIGGLLMVCDGVEFLVGSVVC